MTTHLPHGFGVTAETLAPTELDIQVLSAQLGRKVRDVAEIPARCVCGTRWWLLPPRVCRTELLSPPSFTWRTLLSLQQRLASKQKVQCTQ